VGTTQRARRSAWETWLEFCADYNIPITLQELEKPHIPLIVFAQLRRQGTYSGGVPVRAGTVSATLLAVRKEIERLVDTDPAMAKNKDRFVWQIEQLLAAYRKLDPAPSRSWPVTPSMLAYLHGMVGRDNRPSHWGREKLCAAVDLSVIAFFFLLRPGEYAHTSDNAPFRQRDIQLGARDSPTFRLAHAAPLNDVQGYDIVSYTFTDQKNAVKDETISHSSNNHPFLCPVKATLRRLTHLRKNGAPAEAPIYTYYRKSKAYKITNTHIGQLLKHAATALQPHTGIPPGKITPRSLRSGGATALLNAHADDNSIRLVGRWKSDAMFVYLRTQAESITKDFSQMMLDNNFRLPAAVEDIDESNLLPQDLPTALLDAYNEVDLSMLHLNSPTALADLDATALQFLENPPATP